MKKAQFYRRVRGLARNLKEYFIEEEPRDKARRTLQGATQALNRTVYQRMALEYEYNSGALDPEARAWCGKNLGHLREAERAMVEQLALLREQYRKLALQDLFFKTLANPGADTFELAHMALMELKATVEAEQTLHDLPRLLDLRVRETPPPPPPPEASSPETSLNESPADPLAEEEFGAADGEGELPRTTVDPNLLG